MFLIGGLFLPGSLARKNKDAFVRDRTLRLFLPFITIGTLLMLIAYYPSYYLATGDTNLIRHIADFFTHQGWPAGPTWFIWMLFVFNIVFLIGYPWLKRCPVLSSGTFGKLAKKPSLMFFLLLCISWLLYVPIAHSVGAGTWRGIGPFDFQYSRPLLYLGYFLIGVALGLGDFEKTVFAQNSDIVTRWWLWSIACLVSFVALTLVSPYLSSLVRDGNLREFPAWMIYFTLYLCSCTSSILAFLTVFRRFATNGNKMMSFLSKHAFLIYLTHYAFVNWIQFLLLEVELNVFVKFLFVAVCSVCISAGASHLLKKNPFIEKYW
ncbi:Acyltransferase family protein [Parapedobacter luteus]|uniref:Acyltransferase family protein n=1 Tax=Parapedobacter luteus TaxID=623280 RepID=A0A1T5FVC3_9SPHI|nr:acyltransferase [Parapedobacter luteus]SKC00116.1 Acyltransferase family protein [Parapedobacter luteus]